MKKFWIIGITLAAWLSLAGCATVAKDFTARTVASASRDGFSYDSTKNQESLKASGEFDPATGKVTFKVETTATTPEAAIAATLDSQKSTLDALNKILAAVLPLLTKAAGAAAGVPPIAVP